MDLHLGMRNAAGVVTAVLKMVYTLVIPENVLLMGVGLKDQIYIALRQGSIIVGCDLSVTDILGGIGVAVTQTVMNDIDDEIRALTAEQLRFFLHKLCQLVLDLEINALGVIRGDGGIAVAHSADDTHLHAVALYQHGTFAVVHPFIGGAVINVDGKEREVSQLRVGGDRVFTPVELMVAQSHSFKSHIVHPCGGQRALGQIGLRAALPHITGGEDDHIVLGHLGVVEISGHFIHAHMVLTVKDLAVKVIDIIKINSNDHRISALVAQIVIICIHMLQASGVLRGTNFRWGSLLPNLRLRFSRRCGGCSTAGQKQD